MTTDEMILLTGHLSSKAGVLCDEGAAPAILGVRNVIGLPGGQETMQVTVKTLIRWWATCPESHILRDAKDYLIYRMHGTPYDITFYAITLAGEELETKLPDGMTRWRSLRRLHRDILAPLIAEYCTMEADARRRVEDLMDCRSKMRSDFREGKPMDAKEFQQAMKLVNSELRKAKDLLAHFDVEMFQRELPIFYEEYTRLLVRPDASQALARKHAPKDPNLKPKRIHGMRMLPPVDPALRELNEFYVAHLDKLSQGNSAIFRLIDKHLDYEMHPSH